jgi:hypothetical protein
LAIGNDWRPPITDYGSPITANSMRIRACHSGFFTAV